MLLHHFLEHSTLRFPDKVALVHEGTRATYAQINSMANCLGHWLLNSGVNQGDRVVILLDNSLEYVVSYYGILKAGAVAVPLSTGIKSDGLATLLAQLEPFAIITSKKFEKLFHGLAASLPGRQAAKLSSLPASQPRTILASQPPSLPASEPSSFPASPLPRRPAAQPPSLYCSNLIIKNSSSILTECGLNVIDFDEIISEGSRVNPDLEIDESSLASIIYTSGSTGEPKGVMLSHRNIVSNTLAICEYLHLTENDIQMVVLPFFYVMGKSLLNTHFAVGGRVVINNKFAFPATVLKQMVEENVTGFSGVPSTYAYLLHRSPLARYKDKLHSLRYCSQAGGHMARRLKEELRRALPEHTRIYIMYGATEASARLSYLDPNRFEDKMDSIGRPIPGVTLKLLDEQGKEVPRGTVGELVASGPNIMQGYWHDPEGTAKVLDGNGYHTGDLAYQDEEGFFFVQARKDDLLKVGGHRINPLEIEDAILDSDLAIETVVLGIPDDLLGHRLVAVVCPRNGNCTARDIEAHCARKLPKYKVPSEIKLVRNIPKSPSGKIDRQACYELASP